MTIQNHSSGPGAIYILAIAAIVAVIVVAAASLWQTDNSATNVLSGDPHSTNPASPQVTP